MTALQRHRTAEVSRLVNNLTRIGMGAAMQNKQIIQQTAYGMANRGNWGDVATGIFGNLISAAAAQSVLSGRRKREGNIFNSIKKRGMDNLTKRQKRFLLRKAKGDKLTTAMLKIKFGEELSPEEAVTYNQYREQQAIKNVRVVNAVYYPNEDKGEFVEVGGKALFQFFTKSLGLSDDAKTLANFLVEQEMYNAKAIHSVFIEREEELRKEIFSKNTNTEIASWEKEKKETHKNILDYKFNRNEYIKAYLKAKNLTNIQRHFFLNEISKLTSMIYISKKEVKKYEKRIKNINNLNSEYNYLSSTNKMLFKLALKKDTKLYNMHATIAYKGYSNVMKDKVHFIVMDSKKAIRAGLGLIRAKIDNWGLDGGGFDQIPVFSFDEMWLRKMYMRDMTDSQIYNATDDLNRRTGWE